MSDAILPNMKFRGFMYELKIATFGVKNQHPAFSYYTSFSGRGYCLINTFGHGIGAVAKPIVYLATTFFYSILALKNLCCGGESKEYAWKALNSLGGMLASPFSQVILAVRAAFGAIFHPGIYFTQRPQLIDMAKDAPADLKRKTLWASYTHSGIASQLKLHFTNQTNIFEVKQALAGKLGLDSNTTILIKGKQSGNDNLTDLEDTDLIHQYTDVTIFTS